MSHSQLILIEGGVAQLTGELNFTSTPSIWAELKAAIVAGSVKQISLKNVASSNSAALAMLVEIKALAKRSDQSVSIVDMPEGLIDLANMSNTLALLEVV